MDALLRTSALALALAAATATAAPGEAWDITIELAMPGMPPGLVAPQQFRSCGPARTEAPPFSGVQSNEECQVTDARKTGSTWTWKLTCQNGIKGSGSITLEGNTAFTGKTEVEMEGQVVTSRLSGKLVGPCDYKGPKAIPAGEAPPTPKPSKRK